MAVPGRVGGAGLPAVCAERDLGAGGEGDGEVERHEADVIRNGQKGVLAAGAQPADSATGVPTETVRHQPFPAATCIDGKRAADLRPKDDLIIPRHDASNAQF
ncbi:hypothetical protein GCM10025331_09550 [Actinoplanes utahensis]|nr:hypothetical protein Aut01nite_16790 [Actinoplanes utahensis]